MENISIPNTQNTQSLAGMAAPKTEVQQAEIKLERVVDTQQTQDKPLDGKDQEQARFEAVRRAATQIVKTNPLSPRVARFTIYRDTLSDGIVFVTRFTNIADGHITTIREPELLSDFGGGSGSILNGLA